MQRTKPPFRADHVGSLLRPAALKEAREKHAKGEIDAAALKAVEDREIERVIKKQEEVGLKAITDGEFRRSWWHLDFLWGLDGAERYVMEQGIAFQGMQTRAEGARIVGKVGFSNHPMLEHFKFVKAHTRRTPKITIPAPSALYGRTGRAAVSEKAYPSLDRFFSELGAAYAKGVRAFADAGCRYLQLDDTVWAYLCSQDELAKAKARGDDVDKLPAIYAKTINTALKSKPADMVVTTHVCRGNFRSTWISEGGYEPVAEVLFTELAVDAYFLEYDDERSGDFAPLRFVPAEKTVVLGLMTSKRPELESVDALATRVDEASRYVPLDQLCLSPQCGFASTVEGNQLTAEQQWAKLGRVVEAARKIWPS
jgi:5-methyltetrahydropteroyltriglutamate--homocysteine methyltransferase